MAIEFVELQLDNFKSYRGKTTFQLNLPAGLYYISGRNKVSPELGANGVGKTSLWDALTWVIWGKTGKDNRPASAVVPWGANGCVVKLVFRVHSREHVLLRSRQPNVLELDGRTVVQEEIPKLLGITEDMFRRTVVLAQFGSLFLDMRPEQQSSLFTDALNLDLWLNASALAAAKHKQSTGYLYRLRSDLDGLNGRLAEIVATQSKTATLDAAWESSRENQLDTARDSLKTCNEQFRELREKFSALAAVLQPSTRPQRSSGRATRDNPAKGPSEPDLAAMRGELEHGWKASQAAVSLSSRSLSDLEAERRGAKFELRTIQEDADKYAAALKSSKQCPSCGSTVSKEHLREKLDALEQKEASLEERIEQLGKAIDTVAEQEKASRDSESIFRDATKGFDRLHNVYENWLREITRLENQSNPHKGILKDLKNRAADCKVEIEKTTEKQGTAERVAEVYAYWVDAFKEIRLNLIDTVLEELEQTVTRHAESLGLESWRIEFKTERTSTSGNVTASFTTFLFPPGSEEPIKFESYSGGEAQRWQLAIAFGLSEVILIRAGVAPNIEVLDEPTRGLSPEGVDCLLENLRSRAKSLGRAIFVTEHHSLASGFFDRTFTVEKGAKGSRIVEDA